MKLQSFPPISNVNAKVLILGTMPSVKSLELNQYYGNKANVFWRLMFDLFNSPFSLDYEMRMNLLLDNKIAVWDVLNTCERDGSLDSAIKSEEPNDFDTFFNEHRQIKLIVLNGKSASDFFQRFCPNPLSCEIITMPSTSPANASMTYMQKLNEWRKMVRI